MKLVQTFVFALISLSVFGQEYQRMYRLGSNVSMEVLDSAKDDAGSTYVLSRSDSAADTIPASLLLAKHNLKGDRDWSIDIVVDDEYELQRFGDMQSIGVDSFLITFSAKKDTSFYQAMLRTTSGGEVEWCYTYIQNPDDSGITRPAEIAVRDTNNIYLATCRIDSTESMSIWQIDNEGQPSTAEFNYVLSDTIQIDSLSRTYNSSFSEISYSDVDTSIIVSGKMIDDTTSLFVAKLDDELNQVWARSFAFPAMDQGQVYDQLVDSDGNIIIIGSLRPSGYRGFVMSIDSIGQLNWFNTFFEGSPSSIGTYFTNATLGSSNEIIIGGSFFSNFISFVPFMISFDQNGGKIWERQYSRANLEQLDIESMVSSSNEFLTIISQGNVMAMPDGGYTFSTSQKDQFTNLQKTGLLIKTDNMGNTFRIPGELSTCDETINLVSGTSELLIDSLILIKSEIDSLVEVFDVVNDDLSDYTTPVLGFLAPLQCPDSINVMLDATLMFASMYEWSTGDTTAMITVTDDEEYTITVTFDTDICFQLCDTFVAPLFPPVEGFIDIDRSRWCTDREFDLEVFGAGGDSEYTYLWDEGETTKTVIRTEPDQQYSVLVTDGCGQDTLLTRFISLTQFEQPDDVDINISCADGAFILTLLSSGDFVVDSTIVWSTGPEDNGKQSIIVEDEGEYSVSFVDDCMYAVGATVNTTDITDVMLNFDDSDYCTDGVIYITALLQNQSFFDINNFSWSTGAADDGNQSIIVTESNMTYTAMITDNCGNVFEESIVIPDLSQEPEVLTLDAQCTENGWIYSITNDVGQITITSTIWRDELSNILAQGTATLTLMNAETVTVTAIDDCLNEVTATITEDQLMSQSMESITINVQPDICMEPQMIELTAVITDGVDPSSIVWLPNAETTSTISISQSEVGTFIVDAVDECGFPVSAEVTVDPDDFYVAPTLTISKSCEESGTTMTASASGDVFWDTGYTWEDGSKDPIRTITQEADTLEYYVVSIEDICGNVVVDSISLNGGDFFPCECVQWPNFLYINSDSDRDQTFGPVNFCGELVENYEMYIYNAYGNLIYKTADRAEMINLVDDVVTPSNSTWDGNNQNSGDPMPSGVYMYYSTYTTEGENVQKKGDVTLIR